MENVRLERQVKIKLLLRSMLLLRGVIQIKKKRRSWTSKTKWRAGEMAYWRKYLLKFGSSASI